MNYYLRHSDDIPFYIFKASNEKDDDYRIEGNVIFTLTDSFKIGELVTPPRRFCKKLELHEVIAYKMLA